MLWQRHFAPQARYPGLDAIDWPALYGRGYRLVLLDIDNTLMTHGRRDSNERARAMLRRIEAAGLVAVLLSNARPPRAAAVAASLGVPAIGGAGKPGTRGILRASRDFAVPLEATVVVGDQLFTDMWAARRAGCRAILVDPIDPDEPWYIRLKRVGERLLMRALDPAYFDELPPGSGYTAAGRAEEKGSVYDQR